MSNLNQATQPKKPLGDGAKAGATSENRILYVLLFVLIGIFFWKVSSDDDVTKSIAQDNPMMPSIKYEEVTSTSNPNVDVEIMDADLLVVAEVDIPKKKESKESKEKKKDIPEKNKINPDFYKSYNLKQMPITNDGGFDNIPAYDYNYIFAGDVNVPEGTFIGMDDNGFAILRKKVTRRALLGGGMAQVETALSDEFYPKGGEIVYEGDYSNNNKINEYPNTVISSGSETYSLDGHSYESLAYQREEEEKFAAEKVKEMPTSRDLEPYIPPSTLGDKDTRMGYGVVIRPKK